MPEEADALKKKNTKKQATAQTEVEDEAEVNIYK